jgi:hypothetical protein
MRFVRKLPKDGDTKTVRKFLLWPKTVYSPFTRTSETRWLETVTLHYTYVWNLPIKTKFFRTIHRDKWLLMGFSK